MQRLVMALLVLAFVGLAVRGQELTERNYDEIKKEVLPTAAEEEWRKIDWHATLWDGVITGQKDEKPIMLFAMNGHPFGCT